MTRSFNRRGRLEVAGLSAASGAAWCAVLTLGQGLRSGLPQAALDARAVVDFACAGGEFIAPLAVITGATLAAARWRSEGALTAAEALGDVPTALLWRAVWPTAAACALVGAWVASDLGPRRLAALRGRAVAAVGALEGDTSLRGPLAGGGAWVVRGRGSNVGAPQVELAVPSSGGLTWISATLESVEPLTLVDARVWSPALRARVGELVLSDGALSPWSLDGRHVTPTSALDVRDARLAFVAHRRVANPCAGAPLAALGAWLAARRSAVVAGWTTACALGGYHALQRALEQAARAGTAPPASAWGGVAALCVVLAVVYGLSARGAASRAAR